MEQREAHQDEIKLDQDEDEQHLMSMSVDGSDNERMYMQPAIGAETLVDQAASDMDHDEDDYEDDEEVRRWEQQAIRKGAFSQRPTELHLSHPKDGADHWEPPSRIPAYLSDLQPRLRLHFEKIRENREDEKTMVQALKQEQTSALELIGTMKVRLEDVSRKYDFYVNVKQTIAAWAGWMAQCSPEFKGFEERLKASSDTERETLLEQWNEMMQSMPASMTDILAVYTEWRQTYPEDYTDAFIGLTLPGVLEFPIKHHLWTTWQPFDLADGFAYTPLDSIEWVQLVMDADEPSGDVLIECIERYIVPFLSDFQQPHLFSAKWIRRSADLVLDLSDYVLTDRVSGVFGGYLDHLLKHLHTSLHTHQGPDDIVDVVQSAVEWCRRVQHVYVQAMPSVDVYVYMDVTGVLQRQWSRVDKQQVPKLKEVLMDADWRVVEGWMCA
jgi:hypothetical protein